MKSLIATTLSFALLASSHAMAADLITGPYVVTADGIDTPEYPTIQGRAAVKDGRTLWFPEYHTEVKLMDIDTCQLPQWAVDGVRAKPVPCGGFAKAWLKRTVGESKIRCEVATYTPSGTPLAYCFRGGLDLGLEMLRVGWARVATPHAQFHKYHQFQSAAMSARYGMWETFVLDMNEWRKRAIDKTLSRMPIADYNLLASRKSEISPAFDDFRATQADRRDR